MKKRVIMTTVGIIGSVLASSAVALAQTSGEGRIPVQESTSPLSESTTLTGEKKVEATIESTTETPPVETTSDNLEKSPETSNSETASTESVGEGQSNPLLTSKETEPSSEVKTSETPITGTIGTSQWTFQPTTGELVIGSGIFNNDITGAFYPVARSTIKAVKFTGPVRAGSSLQGLFSNMDGLSSIEGLAYLDTSQVTDMSNMFYGCSALQTLDVSKFDTSRVTNMGSMFNGCSALQTLDVSSFNTSQVTSMRAMFAGCSTLQTLGVSKFDTSRVRNMSAMFSFCRALQTLDMSSFNTNQVRDMSGMFSFCRALQTLDVSNFNTSQVTNMRQMFYGCSALQTLDVSNFDTSQVTDMGIMFYDCSSLQTLDVSKFNTRSVNDMGSMFNGCSALQTLDVSKFDTSRVTNMGSMFNGCSALQTLDVSSFNTSQVTDMSSMFQGCCALQTLDVSNFDTSKVTDMSSMFNSCSTLQTLDVSSFNTSQVTDMGWMFDGCSALQSLDLSNFDTSKVIDMTQMFYDCSALQTLDVSSFNTSQVTNMFNMFFGCSALQSLDLSNFDTSKVTDMTQMFYNCHALQTLNLSSFDTSQVTDMKNMFSLLYSLKKLTLGSKSIFNDTVNLSSIPNYDSSLYTGSWIGINTKNKYESSDTFMSNYDGSIPDTYVWEVREKVSDLNSTLEPSSEKVHSGSEVEWTWKITNSSSKSADNVYSEITLPEGLKIDRNSIKKNNQSVSMDDINGRNNLGTLTTNETLTFTFKTVASGEPGKWLELMGKVTWEDAGSHSVNSSSKVKILDEEQKDKGNQTNDLELLSVPVGFRYGILNKSSIPQTIHLNARNYQTHTNVVTEGFYTRLMDDRTQANGWKLTAQLSDFKDEENSTVLTNSGMALHMENMKIESIKNRDTPQESIDQNPTGTPSTVSTNKTLISGQAAKTLINAQANEGHGTWQLRIPFDKVSLTVPANTGEINKNYTATLTWSLDDTP